MSAQEAQREESARLDLYRYATADNAGEYLAIMRLFASTLLADLSAAEVAAHLADAGLTLDPDDVDTRCRQLEAWGNLGRSVRDARVATVADFLRSRSRFQVSKLGGRVHRQVDEVLAATTGVREVARELLGGMLETLTRIAGHLATPSPDADALAAEVTTLFSSQRLFTESTRDFYAYLHQVLSRYDLVGEEYTGFKTLLLDYVDLISADVTRHAPAVADRLHGLAPHLTTLLAVLDTMPALANPDGSPGERSPGRARTDWAELTAWYDGSSGRSGPQQLRSAAERALGQLLSNARRMLSSAGTGVSRRSDLLLLAGWFSEADTPDAHRIFDAAFGAYPARHLLIGPEEQDPRAGALTSWWDAEPVDVPVSLRERGDRAARGRTSRVPDPTLDRLMLEAQAEAEEAANRAAATELVAAGALDKAHLSPAARDMILERVADLLARFQELSEPAQSVDSDLGFELRIAPDPSRNTIIHADDGIVTIHGLVLTVAGLAHAGASSAATASGS